MSDKMRILKIICCMLILLGMGFWGNYRYKNSDFCLSRCLAEPERYDNSVVMIGQDAKIVNINKNYAVIYYCGIKMPVILGNGNYIADTLIGAHVSMMAVFHKAGYLEAQRIHLHKYRWLKVLTSLFIVIVFAVIFFYYFSFNFKRFVFEEKRCRI